MTSAFQKSSSEPSLMILPMFKSVRQGHQKRRDRDSTSTVGHPTASALISVKNVIVAVNAAKVTRHALEWALTSVVQSGDQVTLLALLPAANGSTDSGRLRTVRKLWNLSLFPGDCAQALRSGPKTYTSPNDLEDEIKDSCSSMMQDLRAICDVRKARIIVKVVRAGGGNQGIIAMEARLTRASWVILDKQLKSEVKICMDQLRCNLVLVTQRQSKIVRLNLKGLGGSLQGGKPPIKANYNSHLGDEYTVSPPKSSFRRSFEGKDKAAFLATSDADSCISSPDVKTSFTATETGTSSVGSPATPIRTIREVRLFAEGSLDCVDSTARGGGAVSPIEYVSDDENSTTDCGICDFLWEGNAERSGPLCTPASGSPAYSDEGIFDKSLCMSAKPWVEASFSAEGSFADCWNSVSITASGPYASSSSERTTPGRSKLEHGQMFNTSSRSNQAPPSSNGRSSSFSAWDNSGDPLPTDPHTMNDGIGFNDSTCSSKDGLSRGNGFVERSRNGEQNKDHVLIRKELKKFSEWHGTRLLNRQSLANMVAEATDLERTSSVRRAVSLSRQHVPPGPPPLCSICQHQAPVFGKPPRQFSFAELELATGGFSRANFLAEGGFGSVHRGVLPDGQAVAVKQHKPASSQGDIEFCSEVEVLSCAQHRNVVMLIGYCIEDKKRLLVYEFVCNSSLDSHLYARNREPLPWAARQKIAVGAARGLRYLHEECRVGCIVHRDMRPNNILLTHDFEPMVGDFGLARWQPDGDLGVQTRVIGTLGYLAPEYAQSGEVTEKADVYSFGVVLLELATGRKAVDITRPKGQQCLTEWARPLLEDGAIRYQMDPRLQGEYAEYELYCLLHAASLCISKDPNLRPRMSQVLRILEGDIVIDTSGASALYRSQYEGKLDYDVSYSHRMSSEYERGRRSGSLSPPLISYSGSLLLASSCYPDMPMPMPTSNSPYEALRAAYTSNSPYRRFNITTP